MDMTMLTLVILLTVFGLVILLSASEYNGRVRFHDSAYYFKKQLFASALGLGAMYFVSSIDYHFFVRLAPAAYLLSMLLSTAVLLFGQEINGSRRWLNLGPLSFQPSEFAKVACRPGRLQQLKYRDHHSRDWCHSDFCIVTSLSPVHRSRRCRHWIYRHFSCCRKLPSGAPCDLAGS